MPLKSLSKVSVGASRFTRLPNGFTRSSKLTQTMPIDGDNVASIRVVIGTTAVGTGVFNRSATTGITIGVSASGQQTDQQHFGTATVGVVISSTASASVTSTHSGTATASIVITATAAGDTGAIHSGTANIGVTISATASGTASQTHTGTVSVQVNLSASAAGSSFDPLTQVPDETSAGNTLTLYDNTTESATFTSDSAVGTRAVVLNGSSKYGVIDNTFQSLVRSSEFSFSLWAKLTDGIPPSHEYLLSLYAYTSDSSNTDNVAIWVRDTGTINLSTHCDGNNRNATGSSAVFTNGQQDWAHIVVTVGSNSNNYPDYKIYVNGSLEVSETNQSGSPIQLSNFTNTSNLVVGKHNNTFHLDAKVDDLSIWDTELTSTQVSNIYNSGNGTDLTGSSNLVGYWKMGDSNNVAITHTGVASCQVNLSASAGASSYDPLTEIPDESGNNNVMTLNSGASITSTSVIGTKSVDFDGSDDYGEVDDTLQSLIRTSNFSISAWVQFDDSGTNAPLLTTATSTTSGNFDRLQIFKNTSNYIFCSIVSDSSARAVTSGGPALTGSSNWYHVVFTVKSNGNDYPDFKSYVNNSLAGSQTSASSSPIDLSQYTSSRKLQAGRMLNSAGSFYLDGRIDDVSIWDKELSSTEVSNLYNSGSGTDLSGSNNLVGWWKMGDSNTITHSGTATVSVDVTASASGDLLELHSGTASCQVNLSASASGSAFAAFTNNYSIDLDGSDDHIDADNFNPNTQIGTGAFTMSMWMKTDSTSNQIFWYMGDGTANNMMRMNYLASSGGFKIWASIGGTFSNQYPHVNISTSTNTWYHVAVVRSGTTVTLYVNGTNSDSKTHASLGTGFGNGSAHWLGRYWDGSNRLDGHIDEYAIWDEALTSSEIEAIYNSGAPFDLTSDSGNYASSTNLIGYWRFEDNTVSGSGGYVADSSTNSNTLQLFNGPTFSTDVPVFNQFSISLDGSNDYVDLGNPSALQITGDMSIGMWFKTSSGSANRLIAKDGGGGQPRQYVLLLLNNKLRWVRFNSSGTLFTIDSVDTYNDNAWHHVVVTNKSTGTIDMFVDGVQLTEGTGSGNYTVETTNGDDGITMNNASVDIEIGYFAQANSQYFNGLIDEVAIWNDALTASEVTKIYNSGSPINIGSNDGNYTSASNLQGWWRFEENTGTSIADSSSNSNSATLVNGPTFSTTTPS